MLSNNKWKKTSEHKASQYYCSNCGARLPSSQEVYSHLEIGCAKALKLSKALKPQGNRIACLSISPRENALNSIKGSNKPSVSGGMKIHDSHFDDGGQLSPKAKKAKIRDESYVFNPAYRKLSALEQRALVLEDPTIKKSYPSVDVGIEYHELATTGDEDTQRKVRYMIEQLATGRDPADVAMFRNELSRILRRVEGQI
jgi:hypothetical protein